jgi:SAM-dependent methyltransferase
VTSDPASLRTEQYANGANLSARIELHRRFSTAPVPWHEWLFDRMSIPPAARVLELGCGTGLFWRALADRVGPDWSLVLTDFSEGMAREARRITSSLPCRAEVAVVDAQAVPFSDATVDVVVAKHMLYHVPDRDRALKEFRRVLAPGGVLYATTIGTTYMQQLEGLVSIEPSFRVGVLGQFGDETGLELLRRRFSTVEVSSFDDELHVTDAGAVGAYIRSLGSWRSLSPDDHEAILAAVQRDIDRDGAFVVDARSVLFSCSSPG